MGNGLTRLETRFLGEPDSVDGASRARSVQPIEGEEAAELGLVTCAYEDFDWDDELRVMLEERASFSPDAMTGMEANLALRRPRDHGNQDFRRV